VTDDQRRRLTPAECAELLDRPLTGVLSTVARGGWIHAVPVHFLYRDGEIRVLCEIDSAKARNAARTGQATLCVEVAETDRRYVTVAAQARLEQPVLPEDLRQLDAKYGREDFATGWDEAAFAAAAMLVLTPVRWIAWADWD
jgi:nitroimidazol reductase NimA-like FMN-containing flavoprotein (pyridoxamine 5'-phosphate oxidase superfamily)